MYPGAEAHGALSTFILYPGAPLFCMCVVMSSPECAHTCSVCAPPCLSLCPWMSAVAPPGLAHKCPFCSPKLSRHCGSGTSLLPPQRPGPDSHLGSFLEAGAGDAAGVWRAGDTGAPGAGSAECGASEAASGGAGLLPAQAAGLPGGPAAAGPAGAEAAGQGEVRCKPLPSLDCVSLLLPPGADCCPPISNLQILQYKTKCSELEQQLLERSTELERHRLKVGTGVRQG